MSRFSPRRSGLAGSLGVFLALARIAVADPGDGGLRGVVTSSDGAPVADATVTLRGSSGERSARTDTAGHFALTKLTAGSYAVRVAAPGYDRLADRVVGVSDATAKLALTLVRSSSSLVTIGRITANGGDALSTSSVPSTTLDAQRYAAAGYTRVSDVLQDDISTTLVHPLGGSSVLPTSVALRGPDPTETLVDIDGHQVNNGNTGDFDLSLLDPADYSSIELVKGISPSSLVGPDTIDGAINIRTLEPTASSHGTLRLTAGSFNTFGETFETTGTVNRLGYAFSLHRTTSDGETNTGIADVATGAAARIGSAVTGSTALGKLRYAFGRDGDGYAELSFHDQSQFRDLSAALSSVPASTAAAGGGAGSADALARHAADSSRAAEAPVLPELDSFAGTALAAHNAGYGLDIRLPLGAADASGVAPTSVLFRHYTSLVSQSVSGSGAETSPYLYNDRDLINDDTLEVDRHFAHAILTLQYGVRNENLSTDFLAGVVNDQSVARRTAQSVDRFPADSALANAAGIATLGLGQTQRSAVLRYSYDPTARLHLTAATYYSNYSLFGTSIDPRLGLTFDPDARSVVRFSAGTTYQAPQLPELYVPSVLPQPVGGYVSVGNPNLRPDRATEYGLGFEHVFETGSRRTDVSVDLYRVNLRQPASTYLPPLDQNCGASDAGGDGTACPLSYTINAGDAVYQGIEISGQRRIGPFATVRAGYAVRSAYLTSVPASIQDGTLVVGEQTLGLPLQKATLAVRNAPPLGWGYNAGLIYEGLYNELNEPQFALLNAGLTYRRRGFEVNLAGTNLTNVYDRHFTRQGFGVPYAGLTGPIATDAYALQGTAFTLSIARRF